MKIALECFPDPANGQMDREKSHTQFDLPKTHSSHKAKWHKQNDTDILML